MSWGYLEAARDEVPADDHWLSPAERAHLSRLAAPPRRADWRLGRWAAKGALATWLGLDAGADGWHRLEILPDASGRPMAYWRSRPLPDALSLSHRERRALAVVGSPGCAIGCDLELVEPRSAAFVADYFTPGERALVDASPPEDRSLLANLVWSAKESALKLLGLGLSVDTRSVEVELPFGERAPARWAPLGAVHVATGNRFVGWWSTRTGWVVTTLSHPALDAPRALRRGARAFA